MKLRFQLNYRFQGPNAPFLHAADAGYFADHGLEVAFVEGVSLVRATRSIAEGAADVGFGDVSFAMEHALRSGRTDIHCVIPIYTIAPCCLGYLEKGSPLRLDELAGRRLAGPQGDTSARLLPMLLEKNGLAGLPYELLVVSPDERDRLIVGREVAAVTCFDATLMFSMRARGYDTRNLRFLYYADHGLDIHTGALLCSRAATVARPGLLDALIAIVDRAWDDCRRDPGRGVRAVLARVPGADPAIVRDHLRWVLDHQVYPGGSGALRFDRDSARMATTVECAERAAGAAAVIRSTGLADAICYRPNRRADRP